MWKRRARELELEERESKKGRHRHKSESGHSHRDAPSQYYHDQPKRSAIKSRSGHRESNELSHSRKSHSNAAADCCRLDDPCNAFVDRDEVGHLQDFEDEFEDQGLKEEEIEQFLQSRVKRGRGAVGSRMDETGPYPSAHSNLEDASNVRVKEEWEQRIIGPSREVFERQLVLEHKTNGKSKLKTGEAEDDCEGTTKHKVKKREKKHIKKHRRSHKKSKKGNDL